MQSRKSSREPFFNFSEPLPVWTAGAIILFHLLAQLMPQQIYSQVKAYFVLMFRQGDLVSSPVSFALHGLSHGDWGHVIMNSFFIAIFGVIVSRATGKDWRGIGRFLTIFVISIVGGGLTQGVWELITGGSVDLVGASGGASGLFAAAAWAIGGRELMLKWGLGWLVLNMAMLAGSYLRIFPTDIAVLAHLGGYVCGAMLAVMFLRPNSTSFRITR